MIPRHVLMAILVGTVGMIVTACGFAAWRDHALEDIRTGRYHLSLGITSGGQPSTRFEVYDAGGRHLGYGTIQGGAAQFYNVDGSRMGTGRIGR